MKLNKFQHSDIEENYIDLFYQESNNEVEHLISFIESFGTQKLKTVTEGVAEYISIEDIFYIESVDRKYYVYMEKEIKQTMTPLSELETSMSEQGFVRINKSTVVNIYKIVKTVSDVNMRVFAHLENDEILQINRSYKKDFIKRLQHYAEL